MGGTQAKRQADDERIVPLSRCAPAERERLLRGYERRVYNPAFPDASIREDPGVWLRLLGADPYPDPPQPLLEVLLLVGADGSAAGGATIEYYRTAGCGLLTYISIAQPRRGRGLGERLVAEARKALARMAGGEVLLIAETERYQDAGDDEEREATLLRQRRLAGLGARMIDFDYVMPPLRPGLSPHRLHLLAIDGPSAVPGRLVLNLVEELAAALGADLDADPDTRAMRRFLSADPQLPLVDLPALSIDAGARR